MNKRSLNKLKNELMDGFNNYKSTVKLLNLTEERIAKIVDDDYVSNTMRDLYDMMAKKVEVCESINELLYLFVLFGGYLIFMELSSGEKRVDNGFKGYA